MVPQVWVLSEKVFIAHQKKILFLCAKFVFRSQFVAFTLLSIYQQQTKKEGSLEEKTRKITVEIEIPEASLVYRISIASVRLSL